MALASSQVVFIDQSPTTTTTVDITDVDTFGGLTPKAAIITFVQARGDDQAPYTQNEASFNGGDGGNDAMGVSRMGGVFYGFGAMSLTNTTTRQWACGIAHEGHTTSDANNNGYLSSRSARRQSKEHCICIPYYYNDTPMAESTGSFITNGIRLTHNPSTWTTGHGHGTGNLLLEVTLIGGSDFSAYCASNNGGTGDNPTNTNRTIGGIPFRPNVGMFGNAFPASSSSPMDKGDTTIYLSHGWLTDDGAGDVEQFCRNFRNTNNSSNVDGLTRIENDRFNQSVSGTTSGSRYNRCYHTNFDTDGSDFEHNFSMSNPSGGNSQFLGALYMKFDNDDYYLKSLTLPSTNGVVNSLTPSGGAKGIAVQKIFGAGDVAAYGTNYSGSGDGRQGNLFDWTSSGVAATSINWNFVTANQTESNPSFMEFSLDGFRSFGGKYVNSTSTFQDEYAYWANDARFFEPSLFSAGGCSMTFTNTPATSTKTFAVGLGTPVLTPYTNLGTPYLGDKRVTVMSKGTSISEAYRTLKTVWYADPVQTTDGTWTNKSGSNIRSITSVTGGVKIVNGPGFLGHVEHAIPCEPNKEYKLVVTVSADTRTVTVPTFGLAQEITSGGTFKTAGYTQGTTGVYADGDRIPIMEYSNLASSGKTSLEHRIHSVGELIIIDWFPVFQADNTHLTIESVRLYELF